MEKKTSKISQTSKASKIAIISTILTLALIGCGIFASARALRRTSSEAKYIPYMEDDTQYDVMFFGTSHVINALLPMQLWNDYGITSYNFGGHANSLAASYWELVLATTKHKPKVAVLDILGVGWDTSTMTLEYAHLSFDTWPLSKLKIEAVCDMFPSEDAREELLFPYTIYHNRWSEISASDAVNSLTGKVTPTVQKGAELRYNLASPAATTLIPQTQKWEGHAIGQDYVIKFITYCRENDIEPVLINIPYPQESVQRQEEGNSVADIASEYDVPYINMLYMDLVDFDTDCYDEDSHLNPSGARKITDYMGKYLTQQFGFADHREDPDYAQWHADYETYHDYVSHRISIIRRVKMMLMALNHSDFSGTLYIGSDFVVDEQMQKLMDQLGDNLTVYWDSDQVKEHRTRLDVYDKVRDELCVSTEFGSNGYMVVS